MTITIKTKLNDGIYKSSGGGEIVIYHEFTTGPRNLLKAARLLFEHQKKMTQCYGNVGCGRSWLEIDGQEIEEFALNNLLDPDYYGDQYYRPPTQMQRARNMIKKD